METTEKVYTVDDWKEMLEARDSGKQIQVGEDVFDYFLEVLPPVFMNRKFKFIDGQEVRASFGFAEGAEPMTVFWTEAGKSYCRRSTMINPEA